MLRPRPIYYDIGCHLGQSGADPGFGKGGGAVASGARSQDFFSQFSGLFKQFGGKRGWACDPPLNPRLAVLSIGLLILGGGHFLKISKLEVHGTNCYERKQNFQQWPPSLKNKNKCFRVNKLHPVVLNLDISIISGAKNIVWGLLLE